MEKQQWDIFISHASEDKEEIAEPLAKALQQAGLKVWYDAFSLKLGDSLRRSIEQGIRDSKYGVVILSPNFFAKEWTKRELDSLTAKEITLGKVVLPVWHQVAYEDVLKFSPNLADKLAILTAEGLEIVVQQILKVCQPPIHLRSEPLVVSNDDDAPKVFGLNKHREPREYIESDFEDQGKTVVDHMTGLMWQKSVSNNLTYKQAQTYVKQLNRERFAGYNDWRLPTIPELMSLLEPEKLPNGLYINPIFGETRYWCWSADRSSSGWAWGVNFDHGDVYWGNLSDGYYVRCVRSSRAP